MTSFNSARRGAAWKKIIVGVTCVAAMTIAAGGTASAGSVRTTTTVKTSTGTPIDGEVSLASGIRW